MFTITWVDRCSDVEGGGGGRDGAGGGRKYCTYMPNTRLGLWPWMTLPDCRSIFAGENRLDINRRLRDK